MVGGFVRWVVVGGVVRWVVVVAVVVVLVKDGTRVADFLWRGQLSPSHGASIPEPGVVSSWAPSPGGTEMQTRGVRTAVERNNQTSKVDTGHQYTSPG